MQLTPITPVHYPTLVGDRKIIVGNGNGPALYNQTTGDVLSVQHYNIDAPLGGSESLSGNYAVVPRPIGIGNAQGWTLDWFALPGWTRVAPNTNLSAEQVQLAVIAGT